MQEETAASIALKLEGCEFSNMKGAEKTGEGKDGKHTRFFRYSRDLTSFRLRGLICSPFVRGRNLDIGTLVVADLPPHGESPASRSIISWSGLNAIELPFV